MDCTIVLTLGHITAHILYPITQYKENNIKHDNVALKSHLSLTSTSCLIQNKTPDVTSDLCPTLCWRPWLCGSDWGSDSSPGEHSIRITSAEQNQNQSRAEEADAYIGVVEVDAPVAAGTGGDVAVTCPDAERTADRPPTLTARTQQLL